MKDIHIEEQTQAEGEAGSLQGVRRGTRSWVSRIRAWAEGAAKLLSHLGCPSLSLLKNILLLVWVYTFFIPLSFLRMVLEMNIFYFIF